MSTVPRSPCSCTWSRTWLSLLVLSLVVACHVPLTSAYYWSIYSNASCTEKSLVPAYSMSTSDDWSQLSACTTLDDNWSQPISFSCGFSSYANQQLIQLDVTLYYNASLYQYTPCMNNNATRYGVAMGPTYTPDACMPAYVTGGSAGHGGHFYGRFSCSSSSGASGAFSGSVTLMLGMAGLSTSWLVITLLALV